MIAACVLGAGIAVAAQFALPASENALAWQLAWEQVVTTVGDESLRAASIHGAQTPDGWRVELTLAGRHSRFVGARPTAHAERVEQLYVVLARLDRPSGPATDPLVDHLVVPAPRGSGSEKPKPQEHGATAVASWTEVAASLRAVSDSLEVLKAGFAASVPQGSERVDPQTPSPGPTRRWAWGRSVLAVGDGSRFVGGVVQLDRRHGATLVGVRAAVTTTHKSDPIEHRGWRAGSALVAQLGSSPVRLGGFVGGSWRLRYQGTRTLGQGVVPEAGALLSLQTVRGPLRVELGWTVDLRSSLWLEPVGRDVAVPGSRLHAGIGVGHERR